MKIVYARQEWSPGDVARSSIFLAGPTPRSVSVSSWRPGALEILKRLRFLGTVFVPEDEGGGMSGSKIDQICWEWDTLSAAKVIAFWVPRDIKGGMPGFTTNVEFGMFAASGKAILGHPHNADKVRYLDFHAGRLKMFLTDNLPRLLLEAVERADLR